MSDRAKYSRVYWSVLDDAEFEGIRENVRHFGSWSLMLLSSDMAWPAPAYVPPIVPPASIAALEACGLIEILTGGRFRLRGINKERERRKSAATRTVTPNPTGTQLGPNWDPDGRVVGEGDKTSRRQDEESAPALTKAIDYLEDRTGRPWQSRPGSKLYDTLAADIADFGDRWHIAAKAVPGDRPDHAQVVFGASRRLHPIDTPKAASGRGHTRSPEEVEDAFNR